MQTKVSWYETITKNIDGLIIIVPTFARVKMFLQSTNQPYLRFCCRTFINNQRNNVKDKKPIFITDSTHVYEIN